MSELRNRIRNIPLIKFLASLQVTVVYLSLLFILTLWGTIAQVGDGLYAAQERFFYSLYFLALGWIPFPGGQLVLWILFFNLLCVALTRLVYRWSQVGIIIIHFGIMSFFLSAFVTFHFVEESHLTLQEGQAANVSSSYQDWEFAVWKEDGIKRKVVSYAGTSFHSGQTLDFDEMGFSLIVKEYYENCAPFAKKPSSHRIPEAPTPQYINGSGITRLNPLALHRDPGKNLPGGILAFTDGGHTRQNILLFGGEINPTLITIGEETFQITLRPKRLVLPFTLHLIDFVKETHPGTSMARSYKSIVEVDRSGTGRKVVISMNKPFRYGNYTLYQSSYSIDEAGREYSTLAVVKNAGRLLPYISTLITVSGLAIFCLTMALTTVQKRKIAEKE